MNHADSPAYGMPQPTIAGTRAAWENISGAGEAGGWERLLAATGLEGSETDIPALERLLAAMTAAGGPTAQCASAQRIRLACHTRLAAVHDMVHGTV